MEKVTVKICIGTTCFVLGASDLQTLEDHLSPEIARDVEITGTSCLGACKDHHYKKVPCVLIDEKPYNNPSLPDLLQVIEQLVSSKRKEALNDEE